jgi:hypothetical protein
LPTLVSMIINTVPLEERLTVYAVSIVFEKLFGMTLGPMLYGIAIDISPNNNRAGMYLLFWSSILGFIFALLSFLIARPPSKKEATQNSEEEVQKNPFMTSVNEDVKNETTAENLVS